jgi:DNA-binding NarL/FixJ family response regulator
VEAVKVVSSGNLFLDHELAQRIALEKAYGRDGLFGVLSTREFEIFRLIGEGLSTAEVSHRLNLSNKTVSNYATQIKNKLKVQSKSELIRLAIRHGVVEV